MTDPSSSNTPSDTPLDDVMIAMDIVDTLRHDKRIVERELNDEGRRKVLIDELREIYRGQGIKVTDEMLDAGVKALEDERFVYKPPPDTFMTRLAKLYVTRDRWGGYLIAGVAALLVIFMGNYFLNERPKQLALEKQRVELTSVLPKRLRKLASDINSESEDSTVSDAASRLRISGLNAASSGDIKGAHEAAGKLQETLLKLRQAYTIQIVNRRGELTGLWRVPKRNPDTYNYYLVVESVDERGVAVPVSVLNEETGKRETVTKWAVRVPKSVLDLVRADKNDDGILQKGVAGVKSPGSLEPTWKIVEPSGAITRW